ncbi:hypothetical protein [Streptomyces sp. NPDC048659]|uniref:hypothetical protein n=1 Tax=Streptomyces sp. NPDC048659 TaxID=3155489 RepID=UPI00342DA55A
MPAESSIPSAPSVPSVAVVASSTVQRAGAVVLLLQVGYVLFLQLAFALLTTDTGEPDTGTGPALGPLAAEGAVLLLLLGAAAVLGRPALAARVPRPVRAVALGAVIPLQLYVAWAALANALDQGVEPDSVLNVVMVLLSLLAAVAAGLGIRGALRRGPGAA